jgi:ferric-dicitrate binding protein FerR (iron transport regulator)
MSEPNDWNVLARYLSGECSEKQKAEIEEWIQSDEQNARLARMMKLVWHKKPSGTDSDVRKLWLEVAEKAGISGETDASKFSDKFPEPGRWQRWQDRMVADSYRVLRYAAVFFMLLTVGYLLRAFGPNWQDSSDLVTVSIPNGERNTVVLADGSVVALDAGSSMRYPENFTGDTREIFLNGEAYFEIESDAERPFIVHANHAVITVLGTKFNVRAWQENRDVSVAVVEGRISLAAADDSSRSVVVIRDHISVLPETGVPATPKSRNIARYIGWMHNEIYFEDTPLSEILSQLQRWYDVEFIVESSEILSERLNLHFQSDSIDESLELLSALTEMRYRRSGSSIAVTR